MAACRNVLRPQWYNVVRSVSTTSTPNPSSSSSPIIALSTDETSTHYKITLRRSAISLGEKKKGTLISLGIHRRNQTVYHRHSPEVAGKILLVKELLEVHNVPQSLVRTNQEQRNERKAARGYKVLGNRKDAFLNAGVWNSDREMTV